MFGPLLSTGGIGHLLLYIRMFVSPRLWDGVLVPQSATRYESLVPPPFCVDICA